MPVKLQPLCDKVAAYLNKTLENYNELRSMFPTDKIQAEGR